MRQRHLRQPRAIAGLVLALGIGTMACGADGRDEVTARSVPAPPASADVAGSVAPVTGDPSDLLTVGWRSSATVDSLMQIETYEQARDYSVVTFVGELVDVRPRSFLSDEEPFPTSEVEVEVVEVLGGRIQPELSPSGTVTLLYGMNFSEELWADFQPRIDEIVGARYVFFAFEAGEPDRLAAPLGLDVEPVLPIVGDDQVVALGFPGDEHLADAIARGEDVTGTTSPPFVRPAPVTDGPAPLGWTVPELLDQFSVEVGTVTTPEPVGWDAHLRIVAELDAG